MPISKSSRNRQHLPILHAIGSDTSPDLIFSMNDRDASPERPRCRRRDHKPCGKWRYGYLAGYVSKTRYGYRSRAGKMKNGVLTSLYSKHFSVSSYGSWEAAKATAEQHRRKQNKKRGIGENIWRPVTPNHAEIYINTEVECPDTLIVERNWWVSVMAKNKIYVMADPKVPGRCYARMKNKRLCREINKTPQHLETDHIDRDTLHDCSSNLRAVTSSVNKNNRNKSKNNTTGYTGISISKPRNGYSYWVVQCTQEGVLRKTSFRLPEGADAAVIPQYVIDENDRLKASLQNRNGLDPE